jgi:hypothetical protein
MASTNGVIFLESMADFLANPVDICFGSMPTTSTTPAACLVIEGNAVTTNQQIKTNLSRSHHRLQCSRTTLRVHLRRPLVFFVVPTCWETRFSSCRYSTYFFFSSSVLDHHTGHPARHDARILLMTASPMPSEFFHHHFDLLEVCFL